MLNHQMNRHVFKRKQPHINVLTTQLFYIDLQNLLGGNGNVVPPDPIPNSEVKRVSADGSVGDPM